MFDKLPLHDAILRTINVDWAGRSCVLTMAMSESGSSQLIFSGITELFLPRHEPWGRSVSVNSLTSSGPTKFEIEMQSGDVLSVVAANWQFIPEHGG